LLTGKKNKIKIMLYMYIIHVGFSGTCIDLRMPIYITYFRRKLTNNVMQKKAV